MIEETQGNSEWTAEEKAAKAKLDAAVVDIEKAAQGTMVLPMLQFHLLMIQTDVVVDLLAESGAIKRTELWERSVARINALASECRRAVLAQGGASRLAGLKN